MKKSVLHAFLNMVGYKVEDKYLLRKNEDDVEDDVVEFDDEEEEAVQNAVPPQFQKKQQPGNPGQQQPTDQEQPNNDAPDNVALLNQLITDIGGFETFKAVLLAAVEYGKVGQQGQMPMQQRSPQQNAEQKKRAKLIDVVVANSNGTVVEEDLEEVSTKVLEVMANGTKVKKNVDYSVLAPTGDVTKNAKVPVPPAFLLAKQKTQ